MKHSSAFVLALFVYLLVDSTISQTEMTKGNNTEDSANNLYFAQKLLELYGYNGTLNISQLHNLMEAIWKMNNEELIHIDPIESSTSSLKSSDKDVTSEAGTDENVLDLNDGKTTSDSSCTTRSSGYPQCLYSSNNCLSAADIFNLHGVSTRIGANVSQLGTMSPAILYNLQQPMCSNNSLDIHKHKHKPKPAEVWGYSFLCVTLINLCALLGMVFIPFMHKPFYKLVLLYMVALAVGTLAGSSILFLIPEAFELTSEESSLGGIYMWRATVVMAGIYMFFLTERLLKMITDWKQKRESKSSKNERDQATGSVKTHHRHRDDSLSVTFQSGNGEGSHVYQGIPPNSSSTGLMDAAKEIEESLEDCNGQRSEVQANGNVAHVEESKIKAVAWMVIFGDGLHNFIDGLSIGAAFTESTLTGLSVSLAVICEELPHELGDFAILLNSGMSMKQALMYNFLSACMCYLGTMFGILLGEMTAGAHWIFALAGGMFLYISLVDMFPEVHAAAEEEEKRTGRTWFYFLLQNAGLLTGFGLMIILRYYGDMINFDS